MNQEIYGYTLYPPRRHSEPGGPVLEVFIREEPSEHHFDPETVLLTVTDDITNVLQLSIEHPWSGALDLRVCAGPIDLIDRNDKHLECLSYGGELHCEVSPAFTRLILHSTAPILIRPGHSIANLLAEETEILLAERRAAKLNSETFETPGIIMV